MAKLKTQKAGKTAARKPVPRQSYVQLDVIPPACPRCHCTDRTAYFAIKTIQSIGVTPSGVEYSQITFKRTRCSRCGQARVDRIFESPGK